MDTRAHFPVVRRIARALSGRWARRSYAAIFFLLLLITTATRLRSYLMVREIQAVLQGLSEIRLDQTTEEQMTRMVPYLSQNDWQAGGVSHRSYYRHISNESDRLPRFIVIALSEARSDELMRLVERLVDWLGYRFISFDAGVLVRDGRVVHVDYGLANQWVRPQYPGYAGYIVSARSVHGFWMDRRAPFPVSSEEDESPRYRPSGGENGLYVTYASDAPIDQTKRAFKLNLDCFWNLSGCSDARNIAPDLWQDLKVIRHDTYQQLISGKCPDTIVRGRMQYVPDVTVLLLEVTGSRRIDINEEGDRTEDWFTDYNLVEEIRGRSSGSWKNVRFRRTIPSVEEPTREMANQIWPETKGGSRVLFFGSPESYRSPKFYSCRFIPATLSALEIVRKTPVPSKSPEDQIPWGLQ